MRINKVLAISALVFLIIILAYGLKLSFSAKPQILQGQVEAREYNISSKVAGRVSQMLVRRGDKVVAGDLIYAIDSPELKAKLMQAKAVKIQLKLCKNKQLRG